jgi:hypothetical protein
MVEEYVRPEWIFNKLVYIEKKGANEALKAVSWSRRAEWRDHIEAEAEKQTSKI